MAEDPASEIQHGLENFAEAFWEYVEEQQKFSEEAFHAYELALLMDIHQDAHKFKKSFLKGFSLLKQTK